MAWKGVTVYNPALAYTVTGGAPVMSARADGYEHFPYYVPNGESAFNGFYLEFTTRTVAPAYQAGGATLALQPINPTLQPPRAWQYLVGQRRTRAAPQLQYDTPDYFTSGIGTFDEYEVFYGALDEYNFNLLGKREMYVPYNMNKAWATPMLDQLGPEYYNPDIARWELHRVWVVELTLKPGKRNGDARRLLYCDEDTWNALYCDIFDSTGAYWKFIFSIPVALPDIPCLLGGLCSVNYDFHAGVYDYANAVDSSIRTPWMPVSARPAAYFTPGQLAAEAGGF